MTKEITLLSISTRECTKLLVRVKVYINIHCSIICLGVFEPGNRAHFQTQQQHFWVDCSNLSPVSISLISCTGIQLLSARHVYYYNYINVRVYTGAHTHNRGKSSTLSDRTASHFWIHACTDLLLVFPTTLYCMSDNFSKLHGHMLTGGEQTHLISA